MLFSGNLSQPLPQILSKITPVCLIQAQFIVCAKQWDHAHEQVIDERIRIAAHLLQCRMNAVLLKQHAADPAQAVGALVQIRIQQGEPSLRK